MFSCVLIFPQTSSDHVWIRHLLIRNVTRSLGNNTRVTTCSFVTVARPMFVLCIGMSIARVSVLQAWNKFLLQVVGMQHLSPFFSKLGKNGQLPLLQETWPKAILTCVCICCQLECVPGSHGWRVLSPYESISILPVSSLDFTPRSVATAKLDL